jgi:hypothetical protein
VTDDRTNREPASDDMPTDVNGVEAILDHITDVADLCAVATGGLPLGGGTVFVPSKHSPSGPGAPMMGDAS